ncbi:MAG: NapC/NirT family cytochrome c [Desulfobacterales bacterium]|nr:MAG: NapC/NirT family cytochrome c [Desulfobacterales bacterium]
MRLNLINFIIFLALLFVILHFGLASAQTDVIPDTENCLLCHRYPSMGRYDKSGQKRIFYVNEKQFANSVHGKLRCKACHVGLDEIPHTDVKKVDCSSKCHIKEPSTDKEFSHINMVEKYRASVHGEGSAKKPKPFAEDLPTCKYCHNNPMYNPFRGMWGKSEALSNETLARCIGCHTKKDWAEKFYSHFTQRMRNRRSQTEIIALCTSCHEDREKMARHGLESIETYKDTFHWSQVKYGVENAPDCLSCHVPVGYTTHDIRPRTDPVSPINIANRVNTCSNQGGLQTCHPGATARFATGRVHAYGMKAQIIAATGEVDGVDAEAQGLALVRQRAESDIPAEDIYHYKVLKLIKLFYQVLIAGTIGFMCLHQSLDYFRTKRKHKKSH